MYSGPPCASPLPHRTDCALKAARASKGEVHRVLLPTLSPRCTVGSRNLLPSGGLTAIGMFENVTLYHQVTLTGCELPSTSAFALQSKAVPLSRRA